MKEYICPLCNFPIQNLVCDRSWYMPNPEFLPHRVNVYTSGYDIFIDRTAPIFSHYDIVIMGYENPILSGVEFKDKNSNTKIIIKEYIPIQDIKPHIDRFIKLLIFS